MQFFNHYAEQLSDIVSDVAIAPLQGARVAYINQQLADELSLPESMRNQDDLLSALFAASEEKNNQSSLANLLNKKVIAQKYGGHQFGHWNPDLGDGRGVLLAEYKAPDGQLWDLHLKGAGVTPYSRNGDGRAVLRSTIREFLACEALHAMGIPSSRALCLITSQEPVQRERLEPGAMMIRMAHSHIRFGHFEYFYHSGQHDKLQALFDFTFQHHFPHLINEPDKYYQLLRQIVVDTASLIAKWQAQGFNHGVMNTDNMSIHGITFDFGPYAFLDDFQSNYICNHSDYNGRYAFDQQPGIGLWNLNALAHAFSSHLDIEQIRDALQQYEAVLHKEYRFLIAKKMGFIESTDDDKHEDGQLVNDWLMQLDKEKRDYHLSFRYLSEVVTGSNQDQRNQKLRDHFIDQVWISQWLNKYISRVSKQSLNDVERHKEMLKVNPIYVLRNHLAQKVIEDAYRDNFDTFELLLDALRSPFTAQDKYSAFAKPPPDEHKGIALSCSS
ncbi:YdiU family protein [Paraneptunicella aestuarii]|uniref:protein adenylyltransferase SelO n=1 Tax=Paraneptunicella aestuarii TaxID=2831148 RepID=UPI001E5EA7C1|nr:YdiU family protein [Paraneptunicella aestuarii]UAA39023.1 YdiU family protein [Paraneptunicella aestuarii]